MRYSDELNANLYQKKIHNNPYSDFDYFYLNFSVLEIKFWFENIFLPIDSILQASK
jgi:hypothetical protein